MVLHHQTVHSSLLVILKFEDLKRQPVGKKMLIFLICDFKLLHSNFSIIFIRGRFKKKRCLVETVWVTSQIITLFRKHFFKLALWIKRCEECFSPKFKVMYVYQLTMPSLTNWTSGPSGSLPTFLISWPFLYHIPDLQNLQYVIVP